MDKTQSAYDRLPNKAKCQLDTWLDDNRLFAQRNFGALPPTAQNGATEREAYAGFYLGEKTLAELVQTVDPLVRKTLRGSFVEKQIDERYARIGPRLESLLNGEKGQIRSNLDQLRKTYDLHVETVGDPEKGHPFGSVPNHRRSCGPDIS